MKIESLRNKMHQSHIHIFFIFVGITCAKTLAWVTIDGLSSSEVEQVLFNSTPEEEKTFLIKKLMTLNSTRLQSAMRNEMYARAIKTTLFPSEGDERFSKNNAIIRAAFECEKQLSIQDRANKIINQFPGLRAYVRQSGGFFPAFSLACDDLHSSLKNETLYTRFLDEFKLDNASRFDNGTRTIFIDHIPKSTFEVQMAVEKLYNHPDMKRIWPHRAWIWLVYSNNVTLKNMRNSVVELAKVPDISKQVQGIYERSVNEFYPFIKYINAREINAPGAHITYFSYMQSNITENIWNKIVEEIPNWMDYVKSVKLNRKVELHSVNQKINKDGTNNGMIPERPLQEQQKKSKHHGEAQEGQGKICFCKKAMPCARIRL